MSAADIAQPRASYLSKSPKLSTVEAASFLGLSVSTLTKLRLTGGGPAFLKLGRRCLYDVNDLEAWTESKKHKHTSEYS